MFFAAIVAIVAQSKVKTTKHCQNTGGHVGRKTNLTI